VLDPPPEITKIQRRVDSNPRLSFSGIAGEFSVETNIQFKSSCTSDHYADQSSDIYVRDINLSCHMVIT